jgi:GNAT superfamily N-acetyltransferase
MGIEIQELQPQSASEETLRAVYEVMVAVEAEDLPGDSPTPFEQQVLRLSAKPPSDVEVTRWLALDDASIVGHVFCQVWPQEDPDNAFVNVQILPEYRRRGIGRAGLAAAIDMIHADGRGKVIVDCVDGRPWEPSLERLGFKKSLGEKRSRLLMAGLDLALMDTWIERAGERAFDYDLLHLETPIPDQHLESWASVKDAINDEPTEDLEFERGTMTPELWRSKEQNMAERGERSLAAVAVHRSSGAFSGFTMVHLLEHQKDFAYQGDTAVEVAHRDRGLGRLLKAAMVKKLVAEHPEVTRIDTHNAGSNAAMLGINIEMGFKPIQFISAWQGSTDTVRSNLVR